MDFVRQFLLDEGGPTGAEYAVMLALIVMVCLSTVLLVGGEALNFWENNQHELEQVF